MGATTRGIKGESLLSSQAVIQGTVMGANWWLNSGTAVTSEFESCQAGAAEKTPVTHRTSDILSPVSVTD